MPDYARRDIRKLIGCDAILLLPGWGKSETALIEQFIAKQFGIVVELEYPMCSKNDVSVENNPTNRLRLSLTD